MPQCAVFRGHDIVTQLCNIDQVKSFESMKIGLTAIWITNATQKIVRKIAQANKSSKSGDIITWYALNDNELLQDLSVQILIR